MMLILSRKVGEELMIGEDILIRVVKSSGGRVTLAFDAPKQVAIVRSEVNPTPQNSSDLLRRAK